jgi:fatty-acyl-CoA synthase
VIGDDGEEVPADTSSLGEIVLRGNTLMAGYLKDAAATEAAFAGGEFHTGDLAVRHPDGYIEIKDRAKDIIISGGENISSLEIETVLHRHPAVLLAAVVAAPDPKWGEVPCAFVELKPGVPEPSCDELVSFCRERLAGFKVPRRFAFRELPKTATGKIQKFALRSELAETR